VAQGLSERRDVSGKRPVHRPGNALLSRFAWTLCAMAYLVDRSGRTDIVDQIAKTRNNALIRELTDDRALVAWLDTSGLSVDEAASIQPTYGSYPVVVADQKRVSANYALLSMALGGSSLGSLGFNLFTPSRTSGGVGVAAGVATIIAGAAHLDETAVTSVSQSPTPLWDRSPRFRRCTPCSLRGPGTRVPREINPRVNCEQCYHLA